METPPLLRPWLFRIAHNTALDYLRRYEHRNVDMVADPELEADSGATSGSEEQGPDGGRVEAALEVFAALPPVQRSALALKDVLELSLEEAAATMEISVSGGQGSARARARERRRCERTGRPTDRPSRTSLGLRRYADLFNARDWEALRASSARRLGSTSSRACNGAGRPHPSISSAMRRWLRSRICAPKRGG